MIFSRDQIAGHLAMWAVRQSPYPVPEALEQATAGFLDALNVPLMAPPMEEFFEIETEDALYRIVTDAIGKVPEIRAWNERKNGNQSPFNFVSRYSAPGDPDNDFIDLGALARNTSLSAWREAERDKAFDTDFDLRWNSLSARAGRWWASMRHRFA